MRPISSPSPENVIVPIPLIPTKHNPRGCHPWVFPVGAVDASRETLLPAGARGEEGTERFQPSARSLITPRHKWAGVKAKVGFSALTFLLLLSSSGNLPQGSACEPDPFIG